MSGDVVKRKFLLVFDKLSQATDGLGGGDFNWKDATGIVAEN